MEVGGKVKLYHPIIKALSLCEKQKSKVKMAERETCGSIFVTMPCAWWRHFQINLAFRVYAAILVSRKRCICAVTAYLFRHV